MFHSTDQQLQPLPTAPAVVLPSGLPSSETPSTSSSATISYNNGGHTPLNDHWHFWLRDPSRRTQGERPPSKMAEQEWKKELSRVGGDVSTVEELWQFINNMRHVSSMNDSNSLWLLKSVNEPTWDDPNAAHGGRIRIAVTNERGMDEMVTLLMLAVTGCFFERHELVFGMNCQVNRKGRGSSAAGRGPQGVGRIELWLGNGEVIPLGAVDAIMEELKSLFNTHIPTVHHSMTDYQPHKK